MTPRWFERALALSLTALVAFALVAVPAAMIGVFYPIPVSAAAIVAWAILWHFTGIGEGTIDVLTRDERPVSRGALATVLVVVVVLTGFNVRYSSQHLLTERDPGVYVNTARSLANTGKLLIDPQREPYRGVRNENRIQFAAAGYYEGQRSDGKLYPQFVHLLPATLGASSWLVGTRGMLKVNALGGGLALLVFFVFAAKLLRPWPAVGATVALGLNLIQIHFSRDAYTEILTQILLFGGLWVLLSARRSLHPGRAALAGLLIGTASMARLDAFIFLVPVAVYVVYELVSTREGIVPPGHREHLVALSVAAAVPAAIAWIDARLFSPVYLNDLWSSVRLVWLAIVAIAIGGSVLLVVLPRLGSLVRLLREHRPFIAGAAALGIVGLALMAAYVRPRVQTGYQDHVNRFVETLQRRAGLAIDGRRTYAEHTMQWVELYLGPALWAGMLGVALMTREVILGRSRRAVNFLLVFLPMTFLYVWDPTITPDHPWALRRFLPVTIPGLLIGSFWLIDRLAADRSRTLRRGAATALSAWVIAFPAWTIAPVATERTERGLLDVTARVCDYLPDDAAVLVAQTQLLDQNFTQTVRGFCKVPAATAPMDQPLDWYSELAARWAARGRSFYILSPQRGFGLRWPPDSGDEITAVTFENLERTLIGRPDSYETFTLALFTERITPR